MPRLSLSALALLASLAAPAAAQPAPEEAPAPGDPPTSAPPGTLTPDGAPGAEGSSDTPASDTSGQPSAADPGAAGDVAGAPSGAAEAPTPSPDATAAVAQAAPPAGGQSGFMDVRLNLTLTNENVFAEPGETIPSVPGWRFGRPNSLGTLFFDNYDTRFSGYETLSHAVLYKSYDEREWEVEGALVLRINDLAENRIDLSDAGSYVRVARWFDPERQDKARVSLTAFPTSSDRFRLGYSYRLSWGGSPEYRRSRSAVPGVKLQFDSDLFYAFVGAKSAVVLDRASGEEEAVLAGLAGAGADLHEMVRVEVNGGVFDRGSNELQDVIEEKVVLYGGSLQVAVHHREPVTSSIDYKLYRNDPSRVPALFAREEYPGGLSWLVSGEATVLGQTLKDPDAPGSTTTQYGVAADLNARVKYDRTRFRADVQYRDLGFILHSTPSLPTFSDFPDAYERTGNWFADVGVDHNFAGTGFTGGVIVGLDMPATLTTPVGIPGDTAMTGESTAVIRNEGDITILPAGEEAVPQLAVKLQGRLDFARSFAALADIYYAHDGNQTRLTRDDVEEPLTREFGEFKQLGFNFTLQAKF